jgi:very-short-patch-repair endonuclease
MTDSERILWGHLRRKQIEGLQFYRQKPIGNYIVDFYCPSASLIVEVDGGQHFSDSGLKKDQERDRYLSTLGFHVVRIPSSEVFSNLDGVLQMIFEEVLSREKKVRRASQSP